MLDPARDTRNRKTLADHRLEAVICRLPENVLLLTGYWPLSSSAFVVFPRDGRVTLLPVETELYAIPDGAVDTVMSYRKGVLGAPDPNLVVEQLLREAIRREGLERARIGIELGFEAVAAGHTAAEVMVPAARTRSIIEAAAPGATLVDATPALSRSAARKTPREITRLRRANEVAAFGLATFRAMFEPGRRESEVAAQVEAAIMSRGMGFECAKEVRAWAQLMSGHDSARSYSLHPATSSRVIEPGDLGVLELATMVDGYWSDLTRTQVAGNDPDQKQGEMFAAVEAASNAVLKNARSGMTGGDIDALARSVIEERGFGNLFVHLTGHGLGFRYHEPYPTLTPGNRDAVQEGMVTSVEPGLYVEDFGGMRLEQNVAFGRDGVQLLSNAPIELIAQ